MENSAVLTNHYKPGISMQLGDHACDTNEVGMPLVRNKVSHNAKHDMLFAPAVSVAEFAASRIKALSIDTVVNCRYTIFRKPIDLNYLTGAALAVCDHIIAHP